MIAFWTSAALFTALIGYWRHLDQSSGGSTERQRLLIWQSGLALSPQCAMPSCL